MIERMKQLRHLMLSALLLSGCGSDAPPFVGETGTPHPISLLAGVPAVEGRARSDALETTGPFLLDTGAPVSLVDIGALGAASPAWRDMELEAMGLRFPNVRAAVFSLFGDTPCADPRPVGVVGTDLLRHLTVDLDFRGRQVTLHVDPPPFAVSDTEPAVSVPLQLLGGGRVSISGVEGTRKLPATRALLEVEIEGTTRWAMIDTGASLNGVRRAVVEVDAATRPQACCFSVSTVSGDQRLPLARVRQLTIPGLAPLSDVAVVVPDDSLFELLSAEVGRKVDLLLGANVLARFGLRIDLQAQELQLARYQQQDHLPQDRWVLPGFTYCRNEAGEALVQDVIGGTDADAKGLRGGERVVAVDGQSLAPLDATATRAALIGDGIGDMVSLRLAGRNDEVIVEVERVLPLF